MKHLFLITFVITLFSCNTKQGTGEPTNDSKANPAEMPVDSVGARTDAAEGSRDSNLTQSPPAQLGAGDLKEGSTNSSDKTLSSDGNIIDKNKKDSTDKK